MRLWLLALSTHIFGLCIFMGKLLVAHIYHSTLERSSRRFHVYFHYRFSMRVLALRNLCLDCTQCQFCLHPIGMSSQW
ncbi:hypothetical protein BJ170DRAFT_629453 [Xylariales sp. AK1849]|nr:hypothetical protein BJ170DRAFT_629453 [Xylariales sp. AK1849]